MIEFRAFSQTGTQVARLLHLLTRLEPLRGHIVTVKGIEAVMDGRHGDALRPEDVGAEKPW